MPSSIDSFLKLAHVDCKFLARVLDFLLKIAKGRHEPLSQISVDHQQFQMSF